MGNDGGSIPTRRELVKEAARQKTTSELKETRHEQQHHAWTTDPISNQPLARPVVSDATGRLYNKDTILEFLVQGTHAEEALRVTGSSPIESLKDVVEVKFEVDEESAGKDGRESWKCPISGARLGPGSKAAYLVPCGHAFAGAALKQVVEYATCLVCEAAFEKEDVIPILSLDEAVAARLAERVKMLKGKGLTHSRKKGAKDKKRKKRDGEVPAVEIVLSEEIKAEKQTEKNGISTPTSNGHATNGDGAFKSRINNTSTASLTAKVMEEQDRAKKRKTANDNVRSLFSTRDKDGLNGNNTDFMTRGFSVPAKR